MKYFEFEILKDRKIIKEKIIGLWTKEIAEDYVKEFEKNVTPLLSDEWSKLVDLNEWKTSQAEIVAIIGKHLEWARKNRMAFSANIIKSAIARGQLRRMFQEGGTDAFSEVFETEELALDWLKEKGF